MKKLYLLTVILCMTVFSFATPVHQTEARKLAFGFYCHYSKVPGTPVIESESVTCYRDLPTFYTFRFSTGGFVIMAADDAAFPVVAYSFDSPMPQEITNPATKEWLESYSRDIWQIVQHQLDNTETLKEWNALRNGEYQTPTRDVNPLLSTTWDQGCYYNALCPADPGAGWTCGHVYTGCVATAMAQIMKYHNFPPQGVGSHSYVHPQYGVQSADFGNTTYDWASMPNNVSTYNTPVATIMYHAGVSVNMQYSVSGSGAYSEDVPPAMLDYFNYHPDITIVYKNNYPNVDDFKDLLRADLDQSLPIYYSGQGTAGHAFVCDGYRLSDGKFHFNWGWSGSSNGWYAIGSLNPGGNTFNDANSAVIHIKPYNPNLIVRIPHPVNNAVIGVGYPVEIEAVTVRGNPGTMSLLIDGIERYSTSNDTLLFTWSTTTADLGSHEVLAYSYTATDTVFYRINLNVAEWISQASGFAATRGISYMFAADSNSVWGTGMDPANPTGACSDFTRTTNGGATWVPGVITNTTGLAGAMIFAMDSMRAYVPMYKVSGTKPQGIYYTSDGGATWAKQTTASFTNPNSFPNCVHFFNENEGWCMGDPISNEFEIYTTVNGGTNWTQVAGSAIPNPQSGEFGVVGYYSAVNDTIWFGTNMGRVYRSPDKGSSWEVFTVPPLSGKYIKPTFRNGSHGLVQDKDAGTTGTICETFDGGQTWTLVTTSGPIYATDLSYIPGTENTWVSSGSMGTNGTSYSFDGGHTWTDFAGTSGAEYMQMTWLNNHCGWAGGVNASPTENGVYKYIGNLAMPLPAPFNLQADVISHDVHLTWEAPPTGNPQGYNMYRNELKLNSTVITNLSYDDYVIEPGQYNYCVKAVYSSGESAADCELVDVAVGIPGTGETALRVYPNPASDKMYIGLTGDLQATTVTLVIRDLTGRVVLSDQASSQQPVDVSSLRSGIYLVSLDAGGNVTVAKLVISK